MIKAIIFDCFGVVISDGLFEAYSSLGGDVVTDKEFIISTVDAGSKGTIPSSGPILAEKLGVSVETWRATQKSLYGLNHSLLDYVLELQKDYRTAMLSNVGIGGLAQWFEPNFLEKYFEVIVESAAIGFAKPEAQAYEITAERLAVRLEECIFIDDRQPYVDGAIAVGMKSILFESTNQLKEDLKTVLASK